MFVFRKLLNKNINWQIVRIFSKGIKIQKVQSLELNVLRRRSVRDYEAQDFKLEVFNEVSAR